MDELEKSRVQEITALHNEIVGHLKISLKKAIRIGELLTKQKQSLEHGGWLRWTKDNLPFTDRTARNYMKLYSQQDKFKTETISDLTLAGAYGLLNAPICHVKHKEAEKRLEEAIQAAIGGNLHGGLCFIGGPSWRNSTSHSNSKS